MFDRVDGLGNPYNALSSSKIATNATTWAGNFDEILLICVGIGLAFATVRFVKGLFF